MLHFAYGSNMDWDQMRERCPSATFVGVAALPDYKLAFTRRSKKRECGVADAVSSQGDEVWGVVYQIGETDIGRLDLREGYRPQREPERNSYVRREQLVFLDNDDGKPQTVSIYFANPEEAAPQPNAEYKGLILSGARRWQLPDAYILSLEQIETPD